MVFKVKIGTHPKAATSVNSYLYVDIRVANVVADHDDLITQ